MPWQIKKKEGYMKKVLETALAAVFLTGSVFADITTSVSVLQGQDLVTYRAADDSKQDEVGDSVGSQSGWGFFNDDYSKNRYTGMSVKGPNYGASISLKFNRDVATSNGYSGYYDYGKLRVGFAGNGLGGSGDLTDHLGELYGLWYYTESLYQWELEYEDTSSRRTTKDYDDYIYNGYNITNAGVPLANKDGGHEFGLSYQWNLFTFRGVLINDRTSTKTGGEYFGWSRFTDFNLQANYVSRDKKDKASITFKMEGLKTWFSDSNDSDDENCPKKADIGVCIAASTKSVKDWLFSGGYSLVGLNLGGNVTGNVSTDDNKNGLYGEDGENSDFSKAYWGHGLNLGAQYKYKDWTFTLANQVTLIFLSEYSKAVSDMHKYGWKPYLGEIASFTAVRKLTSMLTGQAALTYRSYNLNSESYGKAETGISIAPSVTYEPIKNCKLTAGLELTLENLDDTPKALWANASSASWAYVYPRTFSVQIPVTFNITL